MLTGQTDNTDKAGLGEKHGSIASPQGPCGYEVTVGSGTGQKGGEPGYPTQTGSEFPITTRDGFQANAGSGGAIESSMNQAGGISVSGSMGTGSQVGGGISSPFVDPNKRA